MLKNTFILFAASLLFSCGNKQKADLIFHNGKIYSVDSVFGIYEAIAIANGRVLETGSSENITGSYESDVTIDLKGKSMFPGFIDAHCHFLGYGLGLSKVDLVGTRSFDEVIDRVIASANKSGTSIDDAAPVLPGAANNSWIIGRGWDQNDWEQNEMPDNRKLDSLFPDRPVMLTRIDGHAVLANSKALSIAGISEKTKISGGELPLKGKKLSGILVDNAIDLLKQVIPRPGAHEKSEALLNAQANCLAAGITTVDDAGLMKNDIDVIDALHREKKLKMRVYAMLTDSGVNYDHYLKTGPYKTERLNVRAFKFYADGALGSRGACLLKEYADKKNWKGFLLSSIAHFEERCSQVHERGFQAATHCIGDSAYRVILDCYLKAGAKKSDRWRIEHAQVVNPSDMKRSDGVIPSVQPTHATSDMYWAGERLGNERVRHAYAYRQLMQVAGTVALGTDFPVEDISPFRTFFAAVARQDSHGFPAQGFQSENALTREETLKGMTSWAAWSNFEENEKGSLAKGKLADLIILDRDIMSCDIKDVLQTKVLATYISGEKVFGK